MSSQKRKRNSLNEERALPAMEVSQWHIPDTSKEPGTYWTHQLYRGPNKQKVQVIYCRTREECDAALSRISGSNILGFDLEWKTMGGGRLKDQTSVIQLANDAEIVVIHLAGFPGEAIEELLSPALKSILEDPNTIKVGHNITGDGTRLKKHLHINPQGFTEVANLKPETDSPLSDGSLATLIKTFFGMEFDKILATSGWHQSKHLTKTQLTYAGADAYAGLKLFQYFTSIRDPLTIQTIDYEAREKKKNKSNLPSLLDKLKQLRSQSTTDENTTVLSFAGNDVLNRIVAGLPTTIPKLTEIKGIKPSAVERYGQAILDVVQEHVESIAAENSLVSSGTSSRASQVGLPGEGSPLCLNGLTIVFTGVFESMSRDETQMLAKKYGARVTTTLSRKTSYVVLGTEPGPKKLETVKKLGLTTISEEGFLDIIRTRPGPGDSEVNSSQPESSQASWPSTQPTNSSSYPSSSFHPTSSSRFMRTSTQESISSSQDSISDTDSPTVSEKIYNNLYFLRQQVSQRAGFPPAYVATEDLLRALAEVRPASRRSLENMDAELFADLALEHEDTNILNVILDV